MSSKKGENQVDVDPFAESSERKWGSRCQVTPFASLCNTTF